MGGYYGDPGDQGQYRAPAGSPAIDQGGTASSYGTRLTPYHMSTILNNRQPGASMAAFGGTPPAPPAQDPNAAFRRPGAPATPNAFEAGIFRDHNTRMAAAAARPAARVGIAGPPPAPAAPSRVGVAQAAAKQDWFNRPISGEEKTNLFGGAVRPSASTAQARAPVASGNNDMAGLSSSPVQVPGEGQGGAPWKRMNLGPGRSQTPEQVSKIFATQVTPPSYAGRRIGVGPGTPGAEANPNPFGYSPAAMEALAYGQRSGQGHTFAQEQMAKEAGTAQQALAAKQQGEAHTTLMAEHAKRLAVDPRRAAIDQAIAAGTMTPAVGNSIYDEMTRKPTQSGGGPNGSQAGDPSSDISEMQRNYPEMAKLFSGGEDAPDLNSAISSLSTMAPESFGNMQSPIGRAIAASMTRQYGDKIPGALTPQALPKWVHDEPVLGRMIGNIASIGGLGSPLLSDPVAHAQKQHQTASTLAKILGLQAPPAYKPLPTGEGITLGGMYRHRFVPTPDPENDPYAVHDQPFSSRGRPIPF